MTTTGDLLKKINDLGYTTFFDDSYALYCQSGYVIVHSGEKSIQKSVSENLENGMLNIDLYAPIIGLTYGEKWQRIFDALALRYEILENYNMEENENQNNAGTEDTTVTDENVLVSDSLLNESNVSSMSSSNTSSESNSTYPFDSGEETPTNKTGGSSTQNGNGSSTGKTTGNSTQTENRTGTGKKTTASDIVRKLTRRGNIGVTTNAQMQEQYIMLYNEWGNFVWTIWSDLDEVLALPIF